MAVVNAKTNIDSYYSLKRKRLVLSPDAKTHSDEEVPSSVSFFSEKKNRALVFATLLLVPAFKSDSQPSQVGTTVKDKLEYCQMVLCSSYRKIILLSSNGNSVCDFIIESVKTGTTVNDKSLVSVLGSCLYVVHLTGTRKVAV